MTHRYEWEREWFLDSVAGEEYDCPACDYHGVMEVEPRTYGAYLVCPKCGAGRDIHPNELPADPRGG